MIPFRVLAEDKSGKESILQSIYSVNKESGKKSIFVLQKLFIDIPDTELDIDFKKMIAHRICTKHNSTILASYRMERARFVKHGSYVLNRIEFSKSGLGVVQYQIDDKILTTFDAMVYAMNDYLVRNKLVIKRIL